MTKEQFNNLKWYDEIICTNENYDVLDSYTKDKFYRVLGFYPNLEDESNTPVKIGIILKDDNGRISTLGSCLVMDYFKIKEK